MPARKNSTQHVTVVADNPETIDGLLGYLRDAGVSVRGTRSMRGLQDFTTTTSAVVLFPDDFDAKDVTGTLGEIRRVHPRMLLLIVTREPGRFRAVTRPDGRSLAPIVMPRPSLGWTILDAVRAHATPGGHHT